MWYSPQGLHPGRKASMGTRPQTDFRPFWRRFFWPLLLVPTIIIGYFVAHIVIIISVNETEAQAIIDAQLAKLAVEHPEIQITEARVRFRDNEMTLDATGSVTVSVGNHPPQILRLSLSTDGNPEYRRGSVHFTATRFELEEFLINDMLPGDVARELIARAAEIIIPNARNSILENVGVKRALDSMGITIDTEQNNEAISGAALVADALVDQYREIGVRLLESGVIRLLERAPLYTLGSSWKEQVAMAALTDISIKDGVFTATLTGAQFLLTLFFALMVIILAIAWTIAIIRGNGSGIGSAIALGVLGDT